MKDTTRIVTIKRYTDPSEAFIDATLLRDNGIDCCVNGADGEAVLPFMQEQVTLTVASDIAEQAAGIVPDSHIEP